MLSVPSQTGENRGEHLGEFESSSVKTRDAVEGFHLLENSHKLCRGFHQAMKARITCLISFRKLLFSVLTERKTIYKAHMYTSISFMKLLTTWRQSQPYCSRNFRASQRYENTTCTPIKTHVLSKLFYKVQYCSSIQVAFFNSQLYLPSYLAAAPRRYPSHTVYSN